MKLSDKSIYMSMKEEYLFPVEWAQVIARLHVFWNPDFGLVIKKAVIKSLVQIESSCARLRAAKLVLDLLAIGHTGQTILLLMTFDDYEERLVLALFHGYPLGYEKFLLARLRT